MNFRDVKGSSIEYTYDVNGNLNKDLNKGITQIRYNLLNSPILLNYEKSSLKRILVDGGYYEEDKYYFYLRDHMGNNRVVADASGSAIQVTHYYPFGMSFAEEFEEEGVKPALQIQRKRAGWGEFSELV